MTSKLDKARRIVGSARNAVFFTGAGISSESGIATFRDEGGFWVEYPPEDFANLPGLLGVARREPTKLARFLHDFLSPVVAARPNDAHYAISRFQKDRSAVVITQNVDCLHQRAGSVDVLEIHGSMFETKSILTGRVRPVSEKKLIEIVDRLSLLAKGAKNPLQVLRALRPLVGIGIAGPRLPNVVLFGQMLPKRAWDAAQEAARNCDCLIVIGTSLSVHPAAGLVVLARRNNARILHVDLQPNAGDLNLKGSASSIAPALLG